jgi:tocopherol cyclase
MHPAGFHGNGKEHDFFEGWYVKLVSADRGHRFAVIPGLFRSDDGTAEAFVQVLNGSPGRLLR